MFKCVVKGTYTWCIMNATALPSIHMYTRLQGIMLQILLIMLFRIPHYAHYYSFYAPDCYYYSIKLYYYAQVVLFNYKLYYKLCCMKCSWTLYCNINDVSMYELCCCGLKEDFSNENTLSDAADEGCTNKILQAAAAQHGKADSFCFHH